MQLQQKTAKGSLWNLSRTLFVSASDFIVYAVLARVLTISEFALIVFCLLIVEFASIFSRVGIAQNLIQRSSWEQSFSSSTFVFITVLSSIIACLLASFGSLIAFVFYSEQAINIVLGLSVIPLLVGLQVVFKAKLEREFRQASVTAIISLSTAFSALVALLLIYLGYGLWALVIQKVLMNIFILGLLVFSAKFKPSISYNSSHTKELITFCLPLVYLSVLQYLISKVNNLFAAIALGVPAFALISIAKKGHEVMAQSTLSSVNNMIVPSMSRIDNEARLSAFYKLVELSAYIIVPCFIGLAAIAPEFILLAFGKTYESSAILLSITCFAIFAQIITWFIPNLLISVAATNLAMRVFVYELGFITVLAGIGVIFGIKAMVIGSTLASFLLVPFIVRIASKQFALKLSTMVNLVFPPSVASLIMFLSIISVKHLLSGNENSLILNLLVYIVLGVTTYLGALFLFFNKRFFDQLFALKSSIN